MGFTQVPITGTWQTADGRPSSGFILFTLTSPMFNGTAVPDVPTRVRLNAAGSIPAGFTLAANDDPGTTPTTARYRVLKRIDGKDEATYLQVLRASGSIDLTTAGAGVPASQPELFQRITERGTANGYAPLGPDALVPATFLPAGQTGPAGPQGPAGPTGPQGPAGSNASATTDASALTTGTLAYARLPVGTTANTVAAGNDGRLSDARTPTAHSHAQSDVTGLAASLAGKAASSHTHGPADLTGTGTPGATTFYRGDGAWAIPSGGSAAAQFAAQIPVTGAYVAPLCPQVSTGAIPAGSMRASPISLTASGTAVRIGVEVTTAAASTTIALAIYNHDSATGLPGTLLLDAGTVDSTTTGFKEITISQALSAGSYWLAAFTNTATVTVRSNSGTLLAYVNAQSDLVNAIVGVVRASVSTFPSSFGATGSHTATHRVYLRF